MEKSKDLLILSIGPVQPFISAARRTQDLAAASAILSWLSRKALSHAEDSLKLEVIYPQKIESGWSESLPNRMVLLSDQGKGSTIGDELEKFIQNQWSTQIAKKVGNYFQKLPGLADIWNDTALTQVAQFLEIYWVSLAWDGDPCTYGNAYRMASLGLDARKNLRLYPTQAQHGWKCSLCGIRSALGSHQAKQVWEKIRQLRGNIILRSGERLCAVCAIKRFGHLAGVQSLKDIEKFPSTSSISIASFRNAIMAQWDKVQNQVDEFCQILKELQLVSSDKEGSCRKFISEMDGDFFFEDYYLNSKRMRELRGKELASQETKKVIESLKKLINQAVNQIQAPLPSAYYAILALDGDYMGRLLDEASNKQDHQSISTALAQSAKSMREDVENEFLGRMIYCGGDDALALLPVDQTLLAVNKLRTSFEMCLGLADHPGRTASVGVFITHHQIPLQNALEQTRQAREVAKNLYNRNSFVLKVQRRSGESRLAGAKWDDTAMRTLELIRKLIADEEITNKFAYEFQEEALELPGTGSLEARRLELKRLLKRHSNMDENLINNFIENIDVLSAQFVDLSPNENYNEQLAKWLVMMRFMAQEV